MTTFIFPGQGSQKVGMGEALFDRFAEHTAQASAILGYDLKALCLDDEAKQLDKTQYTQPALFVVNALSYLAHLEDHDTRAECFAGHSLGEYNALFAAGAFDFATGVKLVKERGRLMSLAKSGAMAAVIGLSKSDVEAVLHHQDEVTIANENSFTQYVITGPSVAVHALLPQFEEKGARMVVPLNVSGAFHSALMQDAAEEFQTYLQTFSFSPLTYPVIANMTARPYEASANVPLMLARQMTHPVRFTDSIQYLIQNGQTEFVEVGPGKVLSGLIKRIKNEQ